MNSSPSAEEQSKRKLAKKLITPKHLYFSPEHSRSVEAESAEDAVTQLNKKKDEQDNASN